MKSFKILVVFITAFFLIVGSAVAQYDSSVQKEKYIIGFQDKPDPDLVRAHGGIVTHQYTIINAIAAELPEQAATALQRNPNVKYVEIDQKMYALDQELPWGVDKIDADVVHAYNKGSLSIQVAILDTGIDLDHPDLVGRIVGGYNCLKVDEDPMDDAGHGTHCAGIVAAVDNDEGVIGVAPEVGLYAVKVLGSDGSGYFSDIISGIEWAAKGPNGIEGDQDDAEVISMSLGGNFGSDALEQALFNAYNNGTLLVASAGNSGNKPGIGDNVGYPARYPSVIAVAATTSSDSRAYFSSTGPDVELAAPGQYIYSTYWNDAYATLSGTSMACPHVAGVAALIFNSPLTDDDDFIDNDVWDPVEVRQKLQDTAIDLGTPEWFGHGLVYAKDAVDMPTNYHNVAVTGITAPDFVVQGGTASIEVTVENRGSSDETFEVSLVSDNTTTLDTIDDIEFEIQTVTLAAGISETLFYTWNTGSSNLGSHILNATAEHVYGEEDTSDNSWIISVPVNDESSTPEMYVSDISFTPAGRNLKAKVTIRADSNEDGTADSDDEPVSGATVGFTYTNFGTSYGITDSSGTVEFLFKRALDTSGVGDVTILTHDTYSWNDSLDVDGPVGYP